MGTMGRGITTVTGTQSTTTSGDAVTPAASKAVVMSATATTMIALVCVVVLVLFSVVSVYVLRRRSAQKSDQSDGVGFVDPIYDDLNANAKRKPLTQERCHHGFSSFQMTCFATGSLFTTRCVLKLIPISSHSLL